MNIIDLVRDPSTGHISNCDGRPLHETDPERCCYINKVKPLFRALQGMRAWITGIRREQTPERAKADLIERQPGGLIKINPLLHWTRQDISEYIRKYELPTHPLHALGYRSIGCAPCTRPVQVGEDDRAGRWAGTGKHECGIHTDLFDKEQVRRL